MQALHTAATGMAAQELNVQVISNNIANLRTTGFKKQTAAFQDLIYEHVRRVGAQASDQGTIVPVGVDIGGGVKTVGTPRSMTQGTLSQTGNDLDLATGRRLLQDPDARRHLPVHPRRHLPDGQPGPRRHRAGQPGAADHHHPEQRLRPRRQRAGPGLGDAAGFVDVGRSGPDRRDPLHQQGGPPARRQQSVRRDALFRPAAGRHRELRRLRQGPRRAAWSRPMSTLSRR